MFSWLRGKKHLNLYVLSVYVWLGDKILRRLTAVCKDDSLMLNQTGTNLVPRTWICGFSILTSKNFIDLPFSSERENKFPWTWDESYLFMSSRVVSILNSKQPKKKTWKFHMWHQTMFEIWSSWSVILERNVLRACRRGHCFWWMKYFGISRTPAKQCTCIGQRRHENNGNSMKHRTECKWRPSKIVVSVDVATL